MQQLLYFLPSLLSVQVQSRAEQSKGEQSELAQFSSEEGRSFEMDGLPNGCQTAAQFSITGEISICALLSPGQPRGMFISSLPAVLLRSLERTF